MRLLNTIIPTVRLSTVVFTVIIFSQLACKKENTDIPGEPVKNITGTWRVVKLLRNNIDLTTYLDLSGFSIEFKEDGTYTISNQLPFIVDLPGKWKLDDPLRPFAISFEPQGGTAVSSNFNYPVVKGQRQMVLVFSPGCEKNSYEYTLQQ
jgi:hypothetical protein